MSLPLWMYWDANHEKLRCRICYAHTVPYIYFNPENPKFFEDSNVKNLIESCQHRDVEINFPLPARNSANLAGVVATYFAYIEKCEEYNATEDAAKMSGIIQAACEFMYGPSFWAWRQNKIEKLVDAKHEKLFGKNK